MEMSTPLQHLHHGWALPGGPVVLRYMRSGVSLQHINILFEIWNLKINAVPSEECLPDRAMPLL